MRLLAPLLILLSTLSYGQVLPTERSVDWTLAGMDDGDASSFEIVLLDDAGMVSNGTTTNDAIMDSLLNLSFTNGVTFQFGEGNYLFNAPIKLESNMLLKGSGAESTQLTFDLGGSSHSIYIAGAGMGSDTSRFTLSTQLHDNTIELHDASKFQAGDWIRIIQDDAHLAFSTWGVGTIGQIAKISSIQGNTVMLESTLRLAYDIASTPYIKNMNMKRNVGVECLKILRMDYTDPAQTSNIYFAYAENCWITGIESENCTFSHIQMNYSSSITIKQSYFHHAFDYGGGGRGYGVVCQMTSNECLIEDNIFEHLRHAMLLQAGTNGNVYAYNYSFDQFWSNFLSDNGGDIALHGNYPYANLFEQNICENMIIDNSHGANGPYNTFFRNRGEKYGLYVTNTNAPNQNFIGNEIMNTSFPYSMYNYKLDGTGHFEYGNNDKGTIKPTGTEVLADVSYAYTSKPAFIDDTYWAKIGTANTVNTGDIPARIRYNSGALFSSSCQPIPEYYDCNGTLNGDAYMDNCSTCVEGTTGEIACSQDCNEDWGGTAYLDNCTICVEGNTNNTPCIQDCNNDWGGTAQFDNCTICVGGTTGEIACSQDCNEDWGGTAYLDNCAICVEGNTNNTPCIQDCNNDWGGLAIIDSCGSCAGGNTGITATLNTQDCTPTSIETNKDNNYIYPNPCNNTLTIALQEPARIEVMNTQGLIVHQIQSEKGLHTINMSNLRTGIYIVSIQTNNEMIQYKVIKQ